MKKRGEVNFLLVVAIFVVIGVVVWLALLGGWGTIQRYFFTETIYVDASGEELNIDRPGTSVVLDVSGEGNRISLSPETRVLELTLNGFRNKVFLCDNVNPKIFNSGEDNEIIRVEC